MILYQGGPFSNRPLEEYFHLLVYLRFLSSQTPILQKVFLRPLKHVMVLVKGYAQQHVPMDVRVSARAAKVVAKMDVKTHVVADVDKVAKVDVTQCAKVIV